MIDTLRDYARRHQTQMHELLRELVETNSHTRNAAGVNRVNDILCWHFERDGLPFQRVVTETSGDIVLAGSQGLPAQEEAILLCGHTDTVFPAESGFVAYREDDTHAYGPGVIDMKGGLVVAYFAWKALVETGLGKDIPVRFLLVPDEETGSGASRELIGEIAGKSAFALVYECAGPEGETVVGRKGKLSFELTCLGRAGHAAFVIKDKPSAILDLAEKITKLEKLNDPERGISVNVGKIEGGIGPNTVAEKAQALIDCRFLTQADGERIRGEIEKICQGVDAPGTTSALRLFSERPPMEATKGNRQLFDQFHKIARILGIPFREEVRNGVSDANLIAAAGTPVLDGLGPIGGDDHSDREWMLRESLAEKTVLSAAAILQAWEQREAIRAA